MGAIDRIIAAKGGAIYKEAMLAVYGDKRWVVPTADLCGWDGAAVKCLTRGCVTTGVVKGTDNAA